MKILIVEEDTDLGGLWQRHLERQGGTVTTVTTAAEALAHLGTARVDIIVGDLDLPANGAITVADYAAYRHPETRVVFVTARSFFSDGSVFSMTPNACAFLPAATRAEDLAMIVAHHAERVPKQ
ncbi:response regulator [Maritimibacter sp. DP1N21-5]|nr:response regulator [Maritimibacter sp. DP1N21-5]